MRKVETKTEGRNNRSVKELLSIAHVSLEEEDYRSSVFQFLNILNSDPNSAVARFGLGDAYFGLADYENAESTYRLGLKILPRNSDGLFGLAATLRVIESYDEAIEFYERGFDAEPSRTDAYWELAYSREMTGDKTGAEWAYRMCLEKNPNHDIHPDPEGRAQQLDESIPLGRPATPEDIAPWVTFLSSDEARYANGTHFLVDGGMSA